MTKRMYKNSITDIEKDLRNSKMRCCMDCLLSSAERTDYDITEMVKTRQGYKCRGHYKSWSERRRNASRLAASTTISATAK